MARFFLIFLLSLVPFSQILAVNEISNTDSLEVNNKFYGWTDDQYEAFEDSIFASLYPPVAIYKSDSIPDSSQPDNSTPILKNVVNNSYVPNSISIDKTKGVGQIVIKSGTTPTGAKTYEVPIQVYPGMKGLQPNLALTYNSHQGASFLGMGWSIAGLPSIIRGGKNTYYDKKIQGVIMDNSDSFVLNGIRLIKISVSGNYILYESEQGNIKAKGYTSGDVMKYFEVFYPDGNKGVFGFPSSTQNYLFYPLTSFSDLKNNKITYSYTYSSNSYKISSISYNGASVEFHYTDRPDPLLSYLGGYKICETQLLQSIKCKLGATVLNSYTFEYSTKNSVSLLSKINYTSANKDFNPLIFYYGEGLTATAYTKTTTQLYEWYVADNPSMIKVLKGKFDYDSGAEGIIALPNLNPYWKHYRHKTVFRHSQNRFDNKFKGDEKIFLYTGLDSDWASPMPNLVTENGFVDIICADIEGKQEEFVIKINNSVVNNLDQVTFNVYRSNLYTGLAKLYTRTFNFTTVYKDADGGKSIQPKFYYTGDFNGDGKMEVMAVSVHNPFGDTSKPSICYIFDLASNKLLYQSHIFPYNVDFIGTNQSDPKAAINNSDKLLVLDYDGDGKSDICLINDGGINIYTFDISGSSFIPKKISTDTSLNKTNLINRDLLLGEFNGDGLMDLLVSPTSESGGGYEWSIYNSKGNGQFDKSTFSCTHKSNADNTGFLIQDINGDGKTDLIKYDTSGFFTYLAKNNSLSTTLYSSYPSTKSVLIPTNINAHNCFTKLICLKDGIATKYSFPRNDNKESLLTGMINCLGVIEKNNYNYINDNDGPYDFYSKGYGALYPYVNISEPLSVITTSESYLDGNSIDYHQFKYSNAVIHRQGLGFCGFEKITTYNKRGQYLIQEFEPYRFGVLKSEKTPAYEKTFSHTISTQSNKISKITLFNKTEKDLLKGTTSTTTYKYDTYGYPIEESISYSDNINIKKTYSYSSKTTVEDGYNLGFLTNQVTTVTRDGDSYSERIYLPVHSLRLPIVKVFYKDGNQVKQLSYSYDNFGNPTSETIRLYTSPTSQKTTYSYDTFGRLSKTTNHLGLTNTFVYNNYGQVKSIEDHRGGITEFQYDAFGRESIISYPDKTTKKIQYNWASSPSNSLYSITTAETGHPKSIKYFDALNREVRLSESRFDNTIRNIDKLYDAYGNLYKISQPFLGESASSWNTYSYDAYNRIVSYNEASGKNTLYSYKDNSVTTTNGELIQTKTYDSLSNLITLSDNAGSITYNYAADGQLSSLEAFDNISTNFSYDKYRRQISISDPSQGDIYYDYDSSGNIITEENANGETIQNEYDSYNRIIKKTSNEFSTSYSYNELDELISISSSNGTSKYFTFDSFGRLSIFKEFGVDGKWLQKDYSYVDGNINSIKYTSQYGVLTTENYFYSNGHLTEVKLDEGNSIFKLSKETVLGQPSETVTGSITRKYDFSNYGFPSKRTASNSTTNYQNVSYVFDHENSTLSSRTDNIRNLIENFEYDDLNRLTCYSGTTVKYDIKGNITQKSDVGSFEYSFNDKPYAVSSVSLLNDVIPSTDQSISYTSFSRPLQISEDTKIASFTYNGDYDRVKMSISSGSAKILDRYYLGNCYELDQSSSSITEKLYLLGDYYNAPAVLVKKQLLALKYHPVDSLKFVTIGSHSKESLQLKASNSTEIYYILRDYLGSITHVISPAGNIIQELSYDAWGRLRNPITHDVYLQGQEPALFLGRGFTGHEHITQFGLINMNARLYDPTLGRFLAPDPFVQMPDLTQNFNRYTYAMNNPLCYIDQDGKFWWIIAGAIIGGTVNLVYKAVSGQLHSFGDGFAAFGIGALAGGVGAATGGWAFAALGGAAGGVGGFIAGAGSGAVSAAASMPIQNIGNSIYFHDPLMSLDSYVMGITTGAVLGGIANGTIAAINGRNFLTGNNSPEYVKSFSFSSSSNTDNTTELRYISESQSSKTIQSNSGSSSTAPKELIHYTTKENYESIMSSKQLYPSLDPKHARFGEGQYLTNLRPEDYTAGQVSARLFRVPWNISKLTYHIKINVSGLNVIQNTPHNFLIPGNTPLNIENRIVGGGISIFKVKF